MNKQRRKRLAGLHDRLAKIADELEAIRDEEQEAYDNLPDSLQAGQRGDALQESVDTLESAMSSAEELLEHVAGARDA